MKKRLLVFVAALTVFLSAAGTSRLYAFDPLQDACSANPNAAACHENTGNNPILGPGGVLTKGLQILALVTAIAAVIVIIIAGIRFMTSGGDATKVSTAKSTILYAVVGLVVAVLAQSIVIFVLNKL